MVLLHLMRWFRENQSSLSLDLLLLKGGSLIDEMEAVCGDFFLWPQKGKARGFVSRKYLRTRYNLSRWAIRKALRKKAYDLVYVNTGVSCDVLDEIHNDIDGCKLLIHVHELEATLQLRCRRATETWLRKADCVVGVSDLVTKNLIHNHQVPVNKLYKINAFIPELSLLDGKDFFNIRNAAGIPENSILVGGCGSVQWRKGADIFVQVARKVLDIKPAGLDIHFLWIGEKSNERYWRELQYDIEHCNVSEHVRFIGSVDNPEDYFNAFDLFLMTSREDPFPLVCLEAGQAGCPIVCFENAIGSTEYLNDQTGTVAPYLDTGAMADAVVRLATDSDWRTLAGQEVRSAVEPFNLNQCAQQLLDVVEIQCPKPLRC